MAGLRDKDDQDSLGKEKEAMIPDLNDPHPSPVTPTEEAVGLVVEKGWDGESRETNSSSVGEEREAWSGKLDFVMSALSLSVGMGNLWRFPYLCYSNGGGAFLIPYALLNAFIGFPLIFLEYSFGQYGGQGPISIWKACPIFEGIGWIMFTVSFFVSIYYIVIISWCFFYIFASFSSHVPWATCGNWWNTANCSVSFATTNSSLGLNETLLGTAAPSTDMANGTMTFAPVSPSDEYFHRFVLDLSDSMEPGHMGAPRWQLVLCLLLCWVLVTVCLSRGIQSSGKVTYVTALSPYVILVILFVRGITLEGAADGIVYYFTPDWEKLLSAKVWGDAAVQVFFSLSICWGGQLTLASYNPFHNNCLRDAVVVVLGDSLTSVFGGVVVFSFIGYFANLLQVDIDKVATQGPGLAFIIYPQATTTLPLPQLWTVLFMLVLISVGMGTQLGLVQTILTTICDKFPAVFRLQRPRFLLLLCISVALFLLGLPCTTRGGMYVIQLFDTYVASFGTLFCSILLLVAIPWVYGMDRLFTDIEAMMSRRLSRVWIFVWKFFAPLAVAVILVFMCIDKGVTSYAGYRFPLYVEFIGWCFVVIELVCVPAVAVFKIAREDKKLSLAGIIKKLSRPESSWGPRKGGRPSECKDTETPLKGQLSEEQC